MSQVECKAALRRDEGGVVDRPQGDTTSATMYTHGGLKMVGSAAVDPQEPGVIVYPISYTLYPIQWWIQGSLGLWEGGQKAAVDTSTIALMPQIRNNVSYQCHGSAHVLLTRMYR